MSVPFSPEAVLHTETVHGGRAWSGILRRGHAMRLTDLDGGGNVAMLLFNNEERSERYNMPDTLKAQHTFHLSAGRVCYSDMGHVLVSIVDASCAWHDTVCGVSNAAMVGARYGSGSYQQLRNDFHRNGRDLFLIELAKWGLGKPDLGPNVNFFSKVVVDDGGAMRFVPGHSPPGSYVDLRAEMDVLMVFNTCQHPLDPAPAYRPQPVRIDIWYAGAPAADDPCRLSRPENARGFALNAAYFCQHGHAQEQAPR
jgi:urea carboxylase-associated protein 2